MTFAYYFQRAMNFPLIIFSIGFVLYIIVIIHFLPSDTYSCYYLVV